VFGVGVTVSGRLSGVERGGLYFNGPFVFGAICLLAEGNYYTLRVIFDRWAVECFLFFFFFFFSSFSDPRVQTILAIRSLLFCLLIWKV
jgi:hypothetical protein